MAEFSCEVIPFEGGYTKQMNCSSTRIFWPCKEWGLQEIFNSGLCSLVCPMTGDKSHVRSEGVDFQLIKYSIWILKSQVNARYITALP